MWDMWDMWDKAPSVARVMSHIWMSRVSRCICKTYQGTLIRETCETRHLDMSCISRSCICTLIHDSFICGTWLVHMWDMTRSYVGHDSFICASCVSRCICKTYQGTLICETCDTRRLVSHESCPTYEWVVYQGTLICETCETRHLYMSCISGCTCGLPQRRRHIWMSRVTHMNTSCHT